MQIVYLSARPSLLAETLGHVAHFAPVFDDVIVVAPQRLADEFPEGVTVLTDETLTGHSASTLSAMAHTSRNYLLRSRLVHHEAVDPVFVMSDDDSRPLVPLTRDDFITADGRHRRRWFHSMAGWHHRATEFDESILHTRILLMQMGFADPVSYACHMPQVIDRDLYRAVGERFAPWAERYALEEWSTYFIVAAAIDPERFADPEPFATLGWPQFPGEWTHEITPARYLYENHHPALHASGGLYDGLPSSCDPASVDETTIEKLIRWHRLELAVLALDFPDDVDQPWTGNIEHQPTAALTARRLAFRGLKAARGAYRYVSIDERARIAELEGRVRRLERGDGP